MLRMSRSIDDYQLDKEDLQMKMKRWTKTALYGLMVTSLSLMADNAQARSLEEIL